MKISADLFRSPHIVFFIYMLVSILLVMLFRFIFPGAPPPLQIYAFNWKIVHGVLEVINLFPALAFSAIVIPFGFGSYEENYQSFSDMFFKRLVSSVITAICAAVIYCLLFFFVYPIVMSKEENMRFGGNLYYLAKEKAFERSRAGSWYEASHFVNICNRIWFNTPELNALKDEIAINLEGEYFQEMDERNKLTAQPRDRRGVEILEEHSDITAAQAITMSNEAFEERRYFDAHWLANLAGRIARRGSPEASRAAQMASNAWNMISSQEPNEAEERLMGIYNLKLSGYREIEANNWIQAYYIFQELLSLTPNDPDAANFFAISERGAVETAFFIDEMELFLGEILSGALFSLPCGEGRAVIRLSSLTTMDDVAYGTGFEYMQFDSGNNLISSVTALYVKLLPVTINGKRQVLILTHALDRYNKANFYVGNWLMGSEPVSGIRLDVSFEDFLLVADVRRGMANLQISELFEAANKLKSTGYVQQIFQAEILNRLGCAMFFLPVAIFVIIMAWRYRASSKPRYLFVLLLPVLPVVFHGFVFLYRSVFNTIGIWLVLSIGFTAALIVYVAALAVMLFASLIILSAQHG